MEQKEIMVSGYYYGNKIYYKNDKWFYEDGEPVMGTKIRPCLFCGKLPEKDGEDACLGHLPGVRYACCGHGVQDAYIIFENGTEIRGKFHTIIKNGRKGKIR